MVEAADAVGLGGLELLLFLPELVFVSLLVSAIAGGLGGVAEFFECPKAKCLVLNRHDNFRLLRSMSGTLNSFL